MFAIVEINGCILNLAAKKPAIVVNIVHNTTQTTNAKRILPPTGIVEKSNTCTNTEPVLGPLCIIIVAAVIPIPTIRPTDKSVPANIIKPDTPNAKNILGDACCIILKMLLTVKSCKPFFLIGVMIHKKMNTKIIAIYKPFFNKKSRVLNEYL